MPADELQPQLDAPGSRAGSEPSQTARRLIGGTAVKYALLAINLATGLFLLPFTIAHLGKELYGLWMLVASMTAYFQLFDLGFGHSLVRHISEADAHRDERRVNELVSTFVVIFAVLGVVVLAGTAVLAVSVLPRYPNLGAGRLPTAQSVLLILGARMAAALPMSVFGAVATSRQAFVRNGLIAIVVTLLQAIATVLVLSQGHGLVALVASTTAIALASYVAYARTAYAVMPSLSIRPRHYFRRERLGELASFGLYVFLINIAVQIGFNLDNLVVGAWLGTSAVAVFAVAARVADYQRQLCNQLNGLLFPVLVKFGAAGDTASLRLTVSESTRLAFGLVAGVTLTLFLVGDRLIATWVGPEFEDSVWPLYALAVAGVVLVAQQPLGSLLMGTGRHRSVATACVAESVLNLVFSILLVQHYGLFGVALGTMIPVLVINLAWLMPTACRSIALPYREFLIDITRPAVVPLGVTALCGFLLLRVWTGGHVLSVLLQAVVLGVIYCTTFMALLPSAQRARYWRATGWSTTGSFRGTIAGPKSATRRAGSTLDHNPTHSSAGGAALNVSQSQGSRP